MASTLTLQPTMRAPSPPQFPCACFPLPPSARSQLASPPPPCTLPPPIHHPHAPPLLPATHTPPPILLLRALPLPPTTLCNPPPPCKDPPPQRASGWLAPLHQQRCPHPHTHLGAGAQQHTGGGRAAARHNDGGWVGGRVYTTSRRQRPISLWGAAPACSRTHLGPQSP